MATVGIKGYQFLLTSAKKIPEYDKKKHNKKEFIPLVYSTRQPKIS